MLKDDTEKLQDVFKMVSNVSINCRAMADGGRQPFNVELARTHHQVCYRWPQTSYRRCMWWSVAPQIHHRTGNMLTP